MKAIKKLAIFLLVLLMILSFAACGDDGDDKGKKNTTAAKGDEDCDHVWSDWDVTRDSTCGKDGKQERECEECEMVEEEPVLAYGHVYENGICTECDKKAKDCDHDDTYKVVISEVSCSRDGEERKVCESCKAVVKIDRTEAYNHNETETVVVKEATCTEDGSNKTVCKICDKVLEQYTVYSGGHEYTYMNGQYPTCTEIGWYDYYACTQCDHTEYYEEIPATGHEYHMNVCADCGAENDTFEIINAPSYDSMQMVIEQPEKETYYAPRAVVGSASGEIADKNKIYKWSITAVYDGKYFIWLSEMNNNCYIRMYIYNSQGQQLAYGYAYNNQGFSLDLTAGEYLVEVEYGNGYTTYDINVGSAKQVDDISGYNVVVDEMQFTQEVIKYSFTAEVTGLYHFMLTEMDSGDYMDMYVYDSDNNCICSNSYVYNGEGLYLTLNAGETYTVAISNYHGFATFFQLDIGVQQPTVDITGYGSVVDRISYPYQTNYYTFVASGSECRVEASLNSSDTYIHMYLYDDDWNYIRGYSYIDENGGFSLSGLEVGKTYTLMVEYGYGITDYTLNIYTVNPAIAVNSDMAVCDAVYYDNQVNTYTFTADREGDHKIMLFVESYSGYGNVYITIYDSDGNLVYDDYYFYSEDYIDLGYLNIGETYTIHIQEDSGDVEYYLSFQE